MEHASPGSALRTAAIHGDIASALEALDRLAETGGGVDATDGQGFTALMLAARYGHEPMLRLLCERGANPNQRNKFGASPIDFTVAPVLVNTLLEYGCSITYALLDRAVIARDEDLLVSLLERYRIATDTEYVSDLLGLLCSAVRVSQDNDHFVRRLLELGAPVHVPDRERDITPLTEVARYAGVECLRRLLDAGADVNTATRNGETALMFAAYHQQEAMLWMLLEHGADVNAADNCGRTALGNAVHGDTYEYCPGTAAPRELTTAERIVRVLLDHGARASVVNEWGMTPLHLTSSPNCVRWLLAAGAEREVRDEDGRTPLFCAAERGNPAAVHALLEAGADPQAESNLYEGNPLTVALGGLASAQNPPTLQDWPDSTAVARFEATVTLLRQAGARSR